MNCLLLVLFVISTTFGLKSESISDISRENVIYPRTTDIIMKTIISIFYHTYTQPNGGDNRAKLQENGSANNELFMPSLISAFMPFAKTAASGQAAGEPPVIQTTELQCNKHESPPSLQCPLQSVISNQSQLGKEAISSSSAMPNTMPNTMPSYKQTPNNSQATPIYLRSGSSQSSHKKFDQIPFVNFEDLQYDSSEEGFDEDRFGVPKQNGTGTRGGGGMDQDFANRSDNYGESKKDDFIDDILYDDYFEFLFMMMTLYCIQQTHSKLPYLSCIAFISFPKCVLAQSSQSSSSDVPTWAWVVIGGGLIICLMCIGGCIIRKVIKKSKQKYKYEAAEIETEEQPKPKLKPYHKRHAVNKPPPSMLTTQTTVHATPNTPTETFQDVRSYAEIIEDQLCPFDAYVNTIDDIYQDHIGDIQNNETSNIHITKQQQNILSAADEKIGKLAEIFKSSDIINNDLLNKPIITEFCNKLKQHANWPMDNGKIIGYFKVIILRLREIKNNPSQIMDSGRATNIVTEDTEETKENSNTVPPLLGYVIAAQDPTAVSSSSDLHQNES